LRVRPTGVQGTIMSKKAEVQWRYPRVPDREGGSLERIRIDSTSVVVRHRNSFFPGQALSSRKFLGGDGVTSHRVLGELQPPMESSGLMFIWGKWPFIVTLSVTAFIFILLWIFSSIESSYPSLALKSLSEIWEPLG